MLLTIYVNNLFANHYKNMSIWPKINLFVFMRPILLHFISLEESVHCLTSLLFISLFLFEALIQQLPTVY
jgi:hypothetical protein